VDGHIIRKLDLDGRGHGFAFEAGEFCGLAKIRWLIMMLLVVCVG
jgi:hypothetical protein